MKVGDKLTCKKLNRYLTVGNEYEIINISDELFEILDNDNDYKDPSLFSNAVVFEVFYTKEEIRKIKIDSL